MKGRHELKHYLNAADCAQLRARLRAIAKPDENAGEDGGYRIHSLYFDNYTDKAVMEKLSGLSRREKFRLRYYNEDTSFMRLEKKSKANRMCYKESAPITALQCEKLLAGHYDFLKDPAIPLFMELYSKLRYQNLRPRNVVSYHREAYRYPAGNVRITFDSHIKASNNPQRFLSPAGGMIPATDKVILELKYDGFLPDIIRDIVHLGWRNQLEFSKYVVARLV